MADNILSLEAQHEKLFVVSVARSFLWRRSDQRLCHSRRCLFYFYRLNLCYKTTTIWQVNEAASSCLCQGPTVRPADPAAEPGADRAAEEPHPLTLLQRQRRGALMIYSRYLHLFKPNSSSLQNHLTLSLTSNLFFYITASCLFLFSKEGQPYGAITISTPIS